MMDIDAARVGVSGAVMYGFVELPRPITSPCPSLATNYLLQGPPIIGQEATGGEATCQINKEPGGNHTRHPKTFRFSILSLCAYRS